MRRRQFITLLGSAAVAWPLGARAQQASKPVIGFVNSASAQSYTAQLTAFHKGVEARGFVDGRNVAIEYRWADGQIDRLPMLICDLIDRRVTVIAATGSPAALAAKAANTTIPIVFETSLDPVKSGLVASMNRPGGNITGVTQSNTESAAKRLQLMHELLPAVRVMALLVNPADAVLTAVTENEVQAAARNLGLQVHVVRARSEREFESVFTQLAELKAGGLVIGGSALFTSHSAQLGALAARRGIPAIYQHRGFIVTGGLLSYGSDVTDAYRLTGIYVGRILNGDKPSDLPVQQINKFELYINLKSAKALGIEVPLPLLGRADEVIE